MHGPHALVCACIHQPAHSPRLPATCIAPPHSYAFARPDVNEHTYGCAFCALDLAGRLDLVMAEWGALARARVDIGPVGASSLIKVCGQAGGWAGGARVGGLAGCAGFACPPLGKLFLPAGAAASADPKWPPKNTHCAQVCARARNVDLALTVFDQLLKRRVTFNRFAYNCVVHLCGVAGRVDDALAAYNLMRLDTDRGSAPDRYTYSALLRAVLVSGRHELLERVRGALDVAPPVIWEHGGMSTRGG